jgi:fructokinase
LFLQNASPKSLRIFDVNLRQSFYDQHVLSKSLRRAHIVKLNDQELPQVSRLLNLGTGTEETLAKRLLNEYGLLLVCITRGALGSILVSESQTVQHGGFRVKIADAIGAGDAFTACLAHYYVREHSLEDLSELANRFASWVATQRGATPRINTSQLQDILAGAIR